MITAVADTHTAIWYVFADVRLSAQAKQTIEEAVAKGKIRATNLQTIW